MSSQEQQTEEEEKLNDKDLPPQTKEPIYIMTIELDQGKAGHIEVFPESIPEEVSYDFCRKNNLDYQSLNYLKNQIEELIDQNKPKTSNKSPPLPKPQLKTNKSKEKDERAQATPVKSCLFSCESFFVTLLERNSTKSNKKTPSQLNNMHLRWNQSPFSQENNQKPNYTPLQTHSNRHYKPIPHPLSRKKEYSPSIRLLHCDSDVSYRCKSNFYKEPSSRSNSQSKRNIGEILYEKGNKLIEKKEKRIEEMRKRLNIQTESEFTFKPLLNNTSKNIIKPNDNSKNQLIQRKDSSTEHPQEKVLVKTRSNGGNRHLLLTKLKVPSNHNLSNQSKSQMRLNVKSAKKTNEFSYHPHLTDYRLTEKTKLPFSSRLKLFKEKYEENRTKLKETLTQNIDNKTGQPYFTPALIAKQKNKSKSPSHQNVFNDLYSYASVYKENKSKRKDAMDKEMKLKKLKACDNSDEIFQKKKACVFKSIFKLFDSDEDGLISIYSIDPNKLPKNIYSILKPIIVDLKEYQGTINCEEFVIEGMKLFESLSYRERKELFEMSKKQKESTEQYSFKPSINRTPKRIIIHEVHITREGTSKVENGNGNAIQ